jgi:hypothetical protein
VLPPSSSLQEIRIIPDTISAKNNIKYLLYISLPP